MSLPFDAKDLEDLKAYSFVYGLIYCFSFLIIKVVVKMQHKQSGKFYEVGPFYVREIL